MRKWTMALLCIVTAVICAACGAPVTYTGQKDDIRAELTFPHAPRANESQTVSITLRHGSQAIDAQNVVCDMQMPGMTMGANRPIADQHSDGSYRCALLFTMSGEWAVVIHGTTASQPFKIVVEHIIVAE